MSLSDKLKSTIRDVKDFPKPGIIFKDIAPLLANTDLFQEVINDFKNFLDRNNVNAIAAIESRGFLVGAPLSLASGLPLILVRKKGKLPGKVVSHEYALEYGTDTVEIQADAFNAGTRLAVIDDVLATGGTALATAELIKNCGGEVAGFAFIMELGFLPGRQKLKSMIGEEKIYNQLLIN